MKKISSLLVLLAALGACSKIPAEAYMNRGGPEGLLDVSSEVVNLDVNSAAAIEELSQWIQDDQPSRAELYCPEQSAACQSAAEALELYGVKYTMIPSSEMVAALVYERILARDCENRYTDNSINPYHLNHRALGCSLAVNMVQHISDKSQIVRPDLLNKMDAAKAVQGYQNYMIRTEPQVSEGVSDSVLSSAQTQ